MVRRGAAAWLGGALFVGVVAAWLVLRPDVSPTAGSDPGVAQVLPARAGESLSMPAGTAVEITSPRVTLPLADDRARQAPPDPGKPVLSVR